MTTFDKENRIKNGEFPTSTTAENRLQIFQATRRPVMREKTIKTPFGTVRVKGKAGQAHHDVLDAIRATGQPARMQDGRIKLLVDPAEVIRLSRQTSGSSFERVLDDLLQIIIAINEPSSVACTGHLIDHIEKKPRRADGSYITKANPLDGKERHLWRVELGKAATHLIDTDFWHFSSKAEIKLLASLRHGVSQAIARHIKTHSMQPNGGWKLDTVIMAVSQGDGETMSKADMKHRRTEATADAETLARLGVMIVGDRVFLSRPSVTDQGGSSISVERSSISVWGTA
jgi:hypothetical protein